MAITQICHQLILNQQDSFLYTIDASCGNGHDTLFLLHHTQTNGCVFAFDIQEQALKATQQNCEALLPHKQLHCFQASHASMSSFIPTLFHQKIDLIMFNLGYLPTSQNKNLCTTKETTLKALEDCKLLLKTQGMISILAYPGHPQGKEEKQSLQAWLSTQHDYIYTEHHDIKKNNAPILWLLNLKAKS